MLGKRRNTLRGFVKIDIKLLARFNNNAPTTPSVLTSLVNTNDVTTRLTCPAFGNSEGCTYVLNVLASAC